MSYIPEQSVIFFNAMQTQLRYAKIKTQINFYKIEIHDIHHRIKLRRNLICQI